jgi:hypothetical protein
VDAHNGCVEAQMEPWKVCKPVAADSPHFDEEQETDPFQSEKLDPDPDLFKVKRWIRIRLEVMRIHNPYRGAHNKMRSGRSRSGMNTPDPQHCQKVGYYSCYGIEPYQRPECLHEKEFTKNIHNQGTES